MPSLKGKTKLVQLPYIYSIPEFLDDCKALIKEICERDESAGLDVLIAVYAEHVMPSLYHIDYSGKMDEVEFCAIGSGSPYASIFKKNWNASYDMMRSARLFSFLIRFTELVDNFVGLNGEKPDIKLIKNDDGKPYTLTIPPEDEAHNKIEVRLTEFRHLISDLGF